MLASSREGIPTLLTVTGPAGAGKSSLLRELMVRAEGFEIRQSHSASRERARQRRGGVTVFGCGTRCLRGTEGHAVPRPYRRPEGGHRPCATGA
ncbi:ATP-binding protein [Agromyces aureus]